MIKKHYFLLLLFVLFSCTSSSTQEQSGDSTSSEAVVTESLPETTVEEEPGEKPASIDRSKLDSFFEQQYSITDSAEAFLQVSVQTNQYEGQSDVMWYFDSLFSPRYFKESWSMEGNEGSTEYIIENESVVCALVEESINSGSSTTTKWCDSMGGVITTWKESADEPENEPLPANYGETCAQELKRYVDILKSLLSDGAVTGESDDSYTIRIEHTVNVGQEVTESVEVSIPKKLYDHFMN